MVEEEAERNQTRESMISDGDGSAANDFHLIAPPLLMERGKGWREEDERDREWEKERGSTNNDKPFSL